MEDDRGCGSGNEDEPQGNKGDSGTGACAKGESDTGAGAKEPVVPGS